MEKNPCGCGSDNSSIVSTEASTAVPRTPVQCPATVHETVCVQAEVKITPKVEVGDIDTFCIGGPVIGPCPGTPVTECTFTVSQNICVEVPLTFSADAYATPSGIVCGTPSVGTCA